MEDPVERYVMTPSPSAAAAKASRRSEDLGGSPTFSDRPLPAADAWERVPAQNHQSKSRMNHTLRPMQSTYYQQQRQGSSDNTNADAIGGMQRPSAQWYDSGYKPLSPFVTAASGAASRTAAETSWPGPNAWLPPAHPVAQTTSSSGSGQDKAHRSQQEEPKPKKSQKGPHGCGRHQDDEDELAQSESQPPEYASGGGEGQGEAAGYYNSVSLGQQGGGAV